MQPHSRDSMWRLTLAGLVVFGLLLAGCEDSTKTKTTEKKEPGDETPNEPSDGPFVDLTTFQAAALVIGQVNMTFHTSNQGGGTPDADRLFFPYQSRVSASGKLVIADDDNYRVVLFDSVPTTMGEAADVEIGQPTMTAHANGSTAADFGLVSDAFLDSNGLVFVADTTNHRVLMYATTPASSGASADLVLGQTNFTNATPGTCTSSGVNGPSAVIEAGGKLIVSDTNHHRILIWNTIPISNNQAANVVVGQGSFSTCSSNDDNQNGAPDAQPSARTMSSPGGVWSDGTKLVVGDWGNNRVLIWNSFPTTNFLPADVVIGQSNMSGSGSGIGAQGMNSPFHVDSNGTQLAVADSQNNRILIWNSFPITNGVAANVVLGQGDFTHNTNNDLNQDDTADANASAQTLAQPYGVTFAEDVLIVSDTINHRVLIYEGQ